MRFRGQDANRIANARKTEHRIPRLDGQEPPFQPGRIVPVTVMVSNPDLGYQRRNPDRPRKEGHELCRIRIASCEPALLHEAGETGAKAEGHRTFDALVDSWWERYHTGCGRPGDAHFPIEVPVWVLTFELDPAEVPRLLSKHSYMNRGYTTSTFEAVDATSEEHDPGEGVSDTWLDRFSIEGHQGQAARMLRQEQRIKERALEDRLAAVRARAIEEGVNLDRHLARIEASLSAAEAKVCRHPKAA